jgi:hypothetical protein
MSTFTYDREQLRERYEKASGLAIASCRTTTELVGGMPADQTGLEQFVRHHLKVPDEKIAETVSRILTTEMDTPVVVDVTPEEGEIAEKAICSVRMLRRSPAGPYIMAHMVKACLKGAASRLRLFERKRGSKGDIAEAGEVTACGCSLAVGEHPFNIHLIGSHPGPLPAFTYYRSFRGRISSPQGARSIVTQCECVEPGTRFAFAFRYFPKKLTRDDIVSIFSMASVVGLGSAKSFESGKFDIDTLEVTEP